MCAKIALGQMSASNHMDDNMKTIRRFARQAARQGTDLLLLPEYAMWYPEPNEALPRDEEKEQAFLEALCEQAQRHHMYVVCGLIEGNGRGRPYNTTVVIDREGKVVRKHRKSHLYSSPGYRESDHFKAGNELFAPLDTDFGRIGLLVCYEIRFPELARLQVIAGAQMLLVASAFVAGPGKVQQWHTLLQARAIENGCYVCASNQTKVPILFGESCAYDPCGGSLGQLEKKQDLLVIDCDLDDISRMRQSNPSVLQRRPDLYRFICE